LDGFELYDEQSSGVYFYRSGTKVKKVFHFSPTVITPLTLKSAIDDPKYMRLRKPSIVNLKVLNSIPSERTNLYREIDNFGGCEFEFLYFRHYFIQNKTGFFFEKAIGLEEYRDCGERLVRATINYCVIRIQELENDIELVVEADISYSKKIDNPQLITALYIGEFGEIAKNTIATLNEISQSLRSSEFERGEVSEISDESQ
jgi:hypothetical protein